MIQNLDDTLFQLFANRLTTLGSPVTATQVRFQPPDAKFRAHMNTLGTRKALNVYLFDLRENRRLRSNERDRPLNPGVVDVWEQPAPARVDCHYLITAWSNADEDLAAAGATVLGRTGAEHQVLHEVATVLHQYQPLVPADVFGGSFPGGFSPELAVTTLPSTLLPVEGFPKYAEFWGTMGQQHPWKPAVYLVVTVPLLAAASVAGPAVTTLSVDHRQWDVPGPEVLIDIGGVVTDSTGAAVAQASVTLEPVGAGGGGQGAVADDEGRFRFDRLPSAQYVFRAGAPGVGSDTRTIAVPSPTGTYDLHLT